MYRSGGRNIVAYKVRRLLKIIVLSFFSFMAESDSKEISVLITSADNRRIFHRYMAKVDIYSRVNIITAEVDEIFKYLLQRNRCRHNESK